MSAARAWPLLVGGGVALLLIALAYDQRSATTTRILGFARPARARCRRHRVCRVAGSRRRPASSHCGNEHPLGDLAHPAVAAVGCGRCCRADRTVCAGVCVRHTEAGS